MKPIGKITMLLAILLASTTLNAQSFKAHYAYDNNGNRISATIVYLSKSPKGSFPIVEEEIKVDPATNLTINIYPNPTQGELRVELAGATNEQLSAPNNAIKVWDMQGRLLFDISPIGSSNNVDLSRYSNGTYIMQLFLGSSVKDYKIIKN